MKPAPGIDPVETGTVTVRLPAVLRDWSGGADLITVPLGVGLTVGGVLDVLAERWPQLERRLRDESGALRRHVNLFVDGDDVRSARGLGTILAAGSELRVLPSVAGG